jgi:phospholipid/cholesterol/gamma-HCH transport system substrate-binding protein
MAANDQQIKQFTEHLSGVSAQLSGEQEELSAALRALGPTLRNVARFVKGNRSALAANVRQLAQITAVLVKEKGALAQFLTTAPTALSNLKQAYDPISGTLDTRPDLRQFNNLGQWICSLAFSLGTPAKQCESLLGPLNPAGRALTSLSLDLSWITAITTHYDPVPAPPDAYGPGSRGNAASGSARPARSGGPQATRPANAPDPGLATLLPGGTP